MAFISKRFCYILRTVKLVKFSHSGISKPVFKYSLAVRSHISTYWRAIVAGVKLSWTHQACTWAVSAGWCARATRRASCTLCAWRATAARTAPGSARRKSPGTECRVVRPRGTVTRTRPNRCHRGRHLNIILNNQTWDSNMGFRYKYKGIFCL